MKVVYGLKYMSARWGYLHGPTFIPSSEPLGKSNHGWGGVISSAVHDLEQEKRRLGLEIQGLGFSQVLLQLYRRHEIPQSAQVLKRRSFLSDIKQHVLWSHMNSL